MKVRCISGEMNSMGWTFKTRPKLQRIPGLTVGKSYDAQLSYNDISKQNDYLILNDLNELKAYPSRLFVIESEE